jgi:riboflavin synthase
LFTGLIECKGKVVRLSGAGGGKELVLSLPAMASEVKGGESIAVDGACLTVTGMKGERVSFDVLPETLKRTTLGSLRSGAQVNVERPLKLGDRLGGHMVQGHVDGVGTIARIEASPGQHTFWFSVPEELAVMLIEKGSVAVDGTSLTVVEVKGDSFSVAVIPHTLEVTTLGEKRVGERVNIEVDMIGKWVRKFVEGKKVGLTVEKLREAGFA